jgi:hypothetical protein
MGVDKLIGKELLLKRVVVGSLIQTSCLVFLFENLLVRKCMLWLCNIFPQGVLSAIGDKD